MNPILQGIDIFAQRKGWLRWHKSHARELTCPACKKNTSMTSRLDTSSPAHRFHRFALFECPACGTGHFPDLKPPAYEGKKAKTGERIRETAALKYYLEQGAGQLSMIEPFFPLADGRKKSLLEIGTGYGLASHFAREALNWEVTGYDPSSLARVGAEDLDLSILPVYLDEHTVMDNGPVDVIYSSEVIEHVINPDGFLAPILRTLKSDGVLVLTTPDIAGISNDRELESLLPLVSPGSHLVLFSKEGLRITLQRAGFAYVNVLSNGDTLVAYGASNPPDHRPAPADQGSVYRNYLQKQVNEFKNHNQLFTGFCGRLIKEQVNVAQYKKAQNNLQSLLEHWQKTFQLDLTKPEELVLPDPDTFCFEEFASKIPFNLCAVLYHAGVLALNHHHDTAKAIAFFDAATKAHKILHQALRKVNVVDIENLILADLATALSIGLGANENPERAAKRLREAQQGIIPDQCKIAYFNAEMDIFSSAANTGKWDIARPLSKTIDMALRKSGVTNDRERSAATGLAMLALNDAFDRKAGLFWLQMALINAPKKPPWTELRGVWGDHAAARGAELLAKAGLQELEKWADSISAGLLNRPVKANDLGVLIALAKLYKATDIDKYLMFLKRALRVAKAEIRIDLKQQIAAANTELFLQAVASNNIKTIEKLRPEAQANAETEQVPQAMLFALGLDDLNRVGVPALACKWLSLASEGSDADLCAEAKTALTIAQQQISDQIIDASNKGEYAKIASLVKCLSSSDKDSKVLYALAMCNLNYDNKPKQAAAKFAKAAVLSQSGELRDLALFHQSLALAWAGEADEAKYIADALFDDTNKTRNSALQARRAELEAEIKGEAKV